jgi:hypothetical protein
MSMMPMPVESEVREALGPFNKRIRDVIAKGFKSFLKKRGTGNLYKRTDSADVFGCVIQAALAEFTGRLGVEVFPNGATARLLFGGKVLVRFKKASRRGRGQNIPTGANDDFLDPSLPFADAPEAMKVEICWKVNDLGTGYSDIYVTARNGVGVLWTYALPGGDQQIIEFPAKPASASPSRRRVAKLKEPAIGRKRNSGSEVS